MEGTDFLVYVTEEDARQDIEENYPGTQEIAPEGGEDFLFEHETDGRADVRFQVWKYTHPSSPELWVVNMMTVTYE